MNILLKRKTIAILICLTINALFTVKYISRYTDYYPAVAGAITLFHLLLFYKGAVLTSFIKSERLLRVINISLVVLLSASSVYIWQKIPVETLNVDRWSNITAF